MGRGLRSALAGTDPILRFDEMLQRFPEARINIDPKAETAVEPLADLILHYGVQDRVCVTSFSRRRTERVKRRVGSDLCTGGATGATIEAIVGLAGIGALRDVDVLQVPPVFGLIPVVTRRFVEFAHGRIHVHVWTIDDPEEMHRLLDLGVDAIMTDRPEVLASVFAERARRWPETPPIRLGRWMKLRKTPLSLGMSGGNPRMFCGFQPNPLHRWWRRQKMTTSKRTACDGETERSGGAQVPSGGSRTSSRLGAETPTRSGHSLGSG